MRTANILAGLLVAFYTLGTLLLPGGDFHFLGELPEMYRHCKATEDKDMTLVDFVTDHLLLFDALVDAHSTGDEQRPHTPCDHHQIAVQAAVPLTRPRTLVSEVQTASRTLLHADVSDLYHFSPLVFVFRPPNG